MLFFGVFFIFIGSITADGLDKKHEDPIQCKDPRPQICTMDYSPVCGISQDGSKKTYANGCGACSDLKMIEYYPGSCAKEVNSL